MVKMTQDEIQAVARAVHGELSHIDVMKYLDMPDDTADRVALAAIAPELVDGVMEVRRLLEEARAIIAGGPENGILPTVASIDLAISKALASLTRAPTSEPDEAEVERVAEWRTIDSAPKDGTVILTVCTYDNPPTYELNQWFEINEPEYVEVGDGLYRREERLFTEGWSNNGHRASHWMPLPPPPSAT